MEKFSFNKSRIVGFSDAVFGIAMTLLILEIAAPSFSQLNKYGLWPLLKAKTPNFIGFIVSFFVTALYWVDYLKITKYVTRFSTKLLWANIFVLFFVVLLPFSTALYVNGIRLIEPFVFYSFNLAMIAVMILVMIRLVYRESGEENGMTRTIRNWHSLRITNTIFVWTIAGLLAFVNINVARFIWILIFIVDPIIDYIYKKKLNQ